MDRIPYPRILLGPGPSSVSPRVLAAASRPPVGYLDPELFPILDELRAGLGQVFGCDSGCTLPITGTGMAGMESCIANLIAPGDRVVVCMQGFFGGRMAELMRRHGVDVTVVEAEWGRTVDPVQVEAAIRQIGRPTALACIHAETSTGVVQPLESLGRIAHDHGALFLVDAVTSLGGMPVEVDRMGIDACYSATQKCLGAPPGLAPVAISPSAWAVVESKRASVWYLDWKLLRDYYDPPHTYHHTIPVNLLFALEEALAEIAEEGLESRYARHRAVSRQLTVGLAALGFRFLAEEEHRLPMLTTVYVPDGVGDEAALRTRLLREYGLEIGGGLGPLKGRIWRIGTMGESAASRNVALLLTALKQLLKA